jgi:hypothetical protein
MPASAIGIAMTLVVSSGLSSAGTLLTTIALSNVTNNEANLNGLILEVYKIDNSTLLFSAANNSGDNGAAIDLIYFDNAAGLFSGINFSTSDSTGNVAFGSGGIPDSPPGTQSSNPLGSKYFSNIDIQFESVASSNPNPPPPDLSSNVNRIHTGEAGGFVANLSSPIGDVLDLSNFRVAYHMQSLGNADNGSDTYHGVGSMVAVPEPSAAAMLGSLGMLILLLRRRN